MHDMKIEIEIDDAVAKDVNRFLATAGQNETSTHGALDMVGWSRCCCKTWGW